EETADTARGFQQGVGVADDGVVAETGQQFGVAQDGRPADVELIETDAGRGPVDLDREGGITVEGDIADGSQFADAGTRAAGGYDPALVDEAADAALARQGGARLDGHDARAQFAVDDQLSSLEIDRTAEARRAVAAQRQSALADLDEIAGA